MFRISARSPATTGAVKLVPASGVNFPFLSKSNEYLSSGTDTDSAIFVIDPP